MISYAGIEERIIAESLTVRNEAIESKRGLPAHCENEHFCNNPPSPENLIICVCIKVLWLAS